MNNISIFLNNNLVGGDKFNNVNLSVGFGDWCLTPVRYLFNGGTVTVSSAEQRLNLQP